jgi:two-component system, LuxR family, sensor kinase FixL
VFLEWRPEPTGNKHARRAATASRSRRAKLSVNAGARPPIESFCLALSADFLKTPTEEVDHVIDAWLEKLASLIQVDTIALWERNADDVTVQRHHFYAVSGLNQVPSSVPGNVFPWVDKQYRQGSTVNWARVPDDIPDEACAERAEAIRMDVKSVLGIPVHAGTTLCVLTFASIRAYRPWPSSLVRRLRLVAEIFAGAIVRQRAELSLGEIEQRFRGAFNHSAIGIALVSLDGRWLQVNAALRRILGYSEAELLATSFQALTHADDLEPDLANLRATLAGEISHYEMEKRYIHKDGRNIWAILTVSLVRGAANEPLYFVSQIQDVTGRRQTQMEIERARLELAHIGRLSLVAQLTSSLAHELLQPITAVLTNAEAGLQTARLAADLETRELFEDIVSSGKRAGDIINHVRGMLRNERGPRRKVDLNNLVREVAQIMRSDLLLHQIRLTMILDPAGAKISCNSVEIQQVLLNLMMNGTEAMSTSPLLERRLVVTTMARASEVELSVQDSGVGVEPENYSRLFEPFFTTKAGGMGMGLSICAEIIREHGGKLWAENSADRGMNFRCVLRSG